MAYWKNTGGGKSAERARGVIALDGIDTGGCVRVHFNQDGQDVRRMQKESDRQAVILRIARIASALYAKWDAE